MSFNVIPNPTLLPKEKTSEEFLEAIRNYSKKGITLEEFNKAFDILKNGLGPLDLAKLNISLSNTNNVGNEENVEKNSLPKPTPKKIINPKEVIDSIRVKKSRKPETPSTVSRKTPYLLVCTLKFLSQITQQNTHLIYQYRPNLQQKNEDEIRS